LRQRLSRWVDFFEETAIAVILGLMVAITFANVVARYLFQSGILWGLEATTYLFAWLVLFGVSYAVKHTAHLGVDALVNILPLRVQRLLGLLAVAVCLLYVGLLLKGGWDYWSKFAFKLNFLEVEDIPFPVWLQGLIGLVEDGEPRYENLPRWIPYFILPFGMALLGLRFVQAGWRIWRGEQRMLIASHEADDLIENIEEDNVEHPDSSSTDGPGKKRKR
jgi:C4-dicarboxylate transporter DctQ subunit